MGHEVARDTVQVWDTEWREPPREAGDGVRMLAPYGRPGARRSERRYVEGTAKNSGVIRLQLTMGFYKSMF
jgi:hypothetical protein